MKTYFKLMFALYFAALLICGACRVLLKLRHIDISTGFYEGGDIFVYALNTVLAAVPVIMFLSGRLKKNDDDYPIYKKYGIVSVISILCGAAMIVFALAGPPEILLEQGRAPIFHEIGGYVNLVLGVISGAAFIYLGVGGVFGRKSAPPGIWMAIPAIWQVILLITRYNGYTTVTTISDHLLVVLFMLFNSLFLLGHARTMCMHMRKDGRNYAIPAGFCASLYGLTLTVPNFVYMFLNNIPIPALREIFLNSAALPTTPLIGIAECAFIFIMSIYSLCFVIGLIFSIKKA